MIIVVTGAYGFIGSNLVQELNRRGFTDILAVDNLSNVNKAFNLVDCEILDFIQKEDFIQAIQNGDYDNQIDYIFHQGACSSTVLQDGEYMMANNYQYSNILLEFAQKNEIPLLYASSASVYGAGSVFVEQRQYESPINIYAYSKFLFDQRVRRYYASSISAPIVGLRYFNVYGINEAHKERMASVALHNYRQYLANSKVSLFGSCGEYANGMQVRDFISIEDVVKVNMFFFENHLKSDNEISGIFNCGTGEANTFNDLSLSVINAIRINRDGLNAISLEEAVASGLIEYIPFPENLKNRYQSYTKASIEQLRSVGYLEEFLSLQEGVNNYIRLLLR